MTAQRKTYDRIAPIYDLLDGPYEHIWKRNLRMEVFRGLTGDLLDAGAGTGCNIVAYPERAVVTAIDASEPMLARARMRASRLGRQIDCRQMDLARLDFPDSHFDAIVATFVFMCIPHETQLAALRELARVCKRQGEIRLVDYRMSEKPLVRAGMKAVAPWLQFTFDGTYVSRTEEHFEAAGLVCRESRLLFGDVVSMRVLGPA